MFLRSILRVEGSFLHFHIFLYVYRLWVYLYFTHIQKTKQKKFPFTSSYILGICSWMLFLLISVKNQDFLIFFTEIKRNTIQV